MSRLLFLSLVKSISWDLLSFGSPETLCLCCKAYQDIELLNFFTFVGGLPCQLTLLAMISPSAVLAWYFHSVVIAWQEVV
jgi:hypothetical protein